MCDGDGSGCDGLGRGCRKSIRLQRASGQLNTADCEVADLPDQAMPGRGSGKAKFCPIRLQFRRFPWSIRAVSVRVFVAGGC